MNKTFVFGDIHGCHQSFSKLLNTISPSKTDDTLVFLGDYINRGPDSNKVISTIIEIKSQFQHVITLMGNHEQVLINYLEGRDKDFFIRIGGDLTLQSYGIKEPWPDSPMKFFPADHLQFFSELMMVWENEDYYFVHAGLHPGTHISQQSSDWMLWARDNFIHTKHNFGKRVIYGHTPHEMPKVDPNKIGIDTGAVYGGKLTCLILPDLEFVYV